MQFAVNGAQGPGRPCLHLSFLVVDPPLQHHQFGVDIIFEFAFLEILERVRRRAHHIDLGFHHHGLVHELSDKVAYVRRYRLLGVDVGAQHHAAGKIPARDRGLGEPVIILADVIEYAFLEGVHVLLVNTLILRVVFEGDARDFVAFGIDLRQQAVFQSGLVPVGQNHGVINLPQVGKSAALVHLTFDFGDEHLAHHLKRHIRLDRRPFPGVGNRRMPFQGQVILLKHYLQMAVDDHRARGVLVDPRPVGNDPDFIEGV